MIYFELALYAEIIMTCFKSKSTHSEYLLRIIRPHIKKQKVNSCYGTVTETLMVLMACQKNKIKSSLTDIREHFMAFGFNITMNL